MQHGRAICLGRAAGSGADRRRVDVRSAWEMELVGEGFEIIPEKGVRRPHLPSAFAIDPVLR